MIIATMPSPTDVSVSLRCDARPCRGSEPRRLLPRDPVSTPLVQGAAIKARALHLALCAAMDRGWQTFAGDQHLCPGCAVREPRS